MSTTPSNVTSIHTDDPAVKRDRSRPTKVLPTERITFIRQLDILRAWAAASGPSGKVAKNDDVAEIVKMQPSTVSIGNAFFNNIGLLTRAEGGYIPAPEVMSFLRAYEWSPETAATKLAPIISKTWFAEELLPKLTFAPMTTDEAVQYLADAASAGPDYKPNLKILLDYMGNAGLIEWDSSTGQVRKGSTNMSARSSPVTEVRQEATAQPETTRTAAAVVPSLFGTTEGAVNFHVSVRVDMGEFAGWTPDRIAAFFGGIAQVLAAKAKVEKAE